MGPLLAGTLGVAALGAAPFARAADSQKDTHEEVVITAGRQSDALVTEEVVTALRQDPFIFSDHVTVTTENGVVRLEGIVTDLVDLHRILRLARRIAGKGGRVENRMEFIQQDRDGN
jgi:osmotically-inducible protein OsmY